MMYTTPDRIKHDIEDASLWAHMLTRDAIVADDASFSHEFGVEVRTAYEFASHNAHTITLDFTLTDLGAWYEWVQSIPKETRWTWDDDASVCGDSPFIRVRVASYAYLQSFNVELVGRSVVASITYAYENEIDTLHA